MDLTIASMSPGDRAALINILDRGLASLTQRQRSDGHAATLVARLQAVLRETPNTDAHTASILAMLMFRPRGLNLNGVNQLIRGEMALQGLITYDDTRSAWLITREGWMQVWASGRAAHVLSEHYNVTLPPATGEVPA